MKRLLVVLSIFLSQILSFTLLAEEGGTVDDIMTELRCAPLTIVNDSVNVITGRYCETAVDIRMAGASGLTFERSSGGHFMALWNINHQGAINYEPHRISSPFRNNLRHKFSYIGPHGQVEKFSCETGRCSEERYLRRVQKPMQFPKKDAEMGITNISAGYISGQTNIKNDWIHYNRDTKILEFVNGKNERHVFKNDKNNYFTSIQKIVFPNMHQWLYDYTEHKDFRKVRAINSSNAELGSITFERKYKSNPKVHGRNVTVESSDGQRVVYTIHNVATDPKKNYRAGLHSVDGTHIPPVTYHYSHGRVAKKELQDGRYLMMDYGKNKNKVARQYGPIGSDTSAVVSHTYDYITNSKSRGAGRTKVYDAYGRLTTYYYNNNRIVTVTYHGKNGKSHEKIDRFFWGQGDNIANIVCRSIADGEKRTLVAATYSYDNRGNVLQENCYGNLSGNCTLPLRLTNLGVVVEPHPELYRKNYTYSDDGFNLLLSESDGKIKITYSYKPNTNILEKKLTWSERENRILKREFYEYDHSGCILREICDDGCGLEKGDFNGSTERRITQYDYSNSPVAGLPAKVIQLAWDPADGSEKTVSTIAYTYTREGWITSKERFDCNGYSAGLSTFAYDRFGHVIASSDPLGQTQTYQYDINGNLICEQGPRADVHKEFKYDFSNRLIAEEEIHANGLRLKRSYSYDLLGNRISECDIYGNIAKHSYDRLNRKVESRDAAGNLLQRVKYNALSHPIVKEDAHGMSTHCSYNVRGSPAHIIYPDGSEEGFTYYFDGTLKKKTEKDGKTTHYTYDCFKRVLKTVHCDAAGKEIFTAFKEYNTFHLLKEYDPEGYETSYEYDYCGRLIKTTKGERIEEIVYDSLGRKSQQIQRTSESDGVITEYSYDALDRIVETTVKSLAGSVQSWELVQYDCDGNVIAVTKNSQDGVATTRTVYDARKKVTKRVDAEGKETNILYRYDYVNEQGLCVPYSEEVDPTGNKLVVIGDIYGRDKKTLLYDPHGKTLHETEFAYDLKGNKLQKTDKVYAGGKYLRDYVCKWQYDASNHPIRHYEAFGTPLQKETQITYNAQGKRASVTKPDGVTVTYDYGSNGLMERVYSSDGSIDYEYAYNCKGNPTSVTDHIHNRSTLREYNRHGEVIHEQQASGMSIAIEYDPLARVKRIWHPDGVSMEYSYDGIYLKKVARCHNNQEQYAHEYAEYSPNGKVAESRMAAGLGTIRYGYDQLGRVLSIDSDYWKETVVGYDEGGNITGKTIVDQIGTVNDTYCYDKLNQLVAEKGTAEHDYESDSLYNRVEKDGEKNEVNELNQLVFDGARHYEYDRNGNIRSIQEGSREKRFTYDAFDRLISLEDGSRTVRFSYDEHNRRLSKEGEVYLFFDSNEVAAVNQEGAIYQRRMLGLGLGGEIGAAVAMELDGGLYVPLHDHNGNVTTLVDSTTGKVAECYRYSAFGEETTDTSGSINPWRFSSKRVDAETGCIFFGRRYYMPETGRWLTADPLGDYDGSNLYAYVKNRPLIHCDIYGLYVDNLFENVHDYDPSAYWAGYAQSWSPVGWGIEKYAVNVLPPVQPRWWMECVGRTIQGLPITKPSYEVESLCETVGSLRCPPGRKQAYHPGMFVDYEGAIKDAWSISNASGGYEVTLLFNPTRGFATDLGDSILKILGFRSKHADFVEDKLKGMYNTLRMESDQPMIFYSMHSRGGLDTYQGTEYLPEEINKSLYMYTYGSARTLRPEQYGDAKNFANERDWIGHIDYFLRRDCKDLVIPTGYRSTSGWWINDHFFDGEGYQKAMHNNVKQYTKDWWEL